MSLNNMDLSDIAMLVELMPSSKRDEARSILHALVKLHGEREERNRVMAESLKLHHGWRGAVLCDVIQATCFAHASTAIMLAQSDIDRRIIEHVAYALSEEQRTVSALFVLAMHDNPKMDDLANVTKMTPADDDLAKWIHRLIEDENAATLKMLQSGRPLVMMLAEFMKKN
ncbi:MAG: hypothetical protein IPN11_14325 [Opitutaceae bacterium]|nr:hypothetical protein [Opitutaceae bacterium]